jgi:putative salt-induced outer membrane protein
MKFRYLGILALLGSFAGPLLAHDEPAAEEKGPWSGEISLGYLSSRGNTDSSSGTASLRVGYDINAWHHALRGKAFGSSENDQTTAENYQAGWKSSYDFTKHNYGFGALDWNKNRFSGYPQQSFATVGYGRRVLDSEKFVMNLEIGAGYAKQKKQVTVDTTENDDGAVGTLGGDFLWNFSESAAFEQTLYAFVASANTYWQSVSKVRANLIGSVALGVSYTLQGNSDVAPGVDKVDSFTAITLDYAF